MDGSTAKRNQDIGLLMIKVALTKPALVSYPSASI